MGVNRDLVLADLGASCAVESQVETADFAEGIASLLLFHDDLAKILDVFRDFRDQTLRDRHRIGVVIEVVVVKSELFGHV